jgi:hypothetical protein
MLARIDNSLLLLLIFVAVSIISSWLQKKQKGQQDEEEEAQPPKRRPHGPSAPPPPPVGRPVPRPRSWEEELKRLLEGQIEEPPAPPPPPTPVVVQPRPPAPRVPPPLPARTAESPRPAEHSPVEVTFQALPGLTQATHAYAEASTMEEKVQQHLREVTQKPVGLTKVLHRASTAEATGARALIRDRHSVRSALLASIILGPPRGLSEGGPA